MTTPIKTLQTELALDLVKIESSDIREDHLQMIEETYEQVYRILGNLDKE